MSEYWERLTDQQIRLTSEFCKGRNLLDLGAGLGLLADLLIQKGAGTAICVDKENYVVKSNHPSIIWLHQTFAEFAARSLGLTFEVAILSWPANNDLAMSPVVEILKRCSYVIYVGCNQGTTQCGTPYLWDYLTSREWLVSLPGKSNLLIYGQAPRPDDQPQQQEEIDGANALLVV
jgi:hypothetical protein